VSSTHADLISAAAKKVKKNLLPVEKALALFYDLDLSVRQYNLLRSIVNSTSEDFFPSYYSLKTYADSLLPSPITVSDICAEVPLQPLLNKTAEGIANFCDINQNLKATLECKWGFDGSSGHSAYKQSFVDESSTDEFMFVVALVPLRLMEDASNQEIWTNKSPSSTLYCRPIKLMFAKENRSLIHEVERDISHQIQRLTNLTLSSNGYHLEISFKMYLTMIDGAVASVLSDVSSCSQCHLCGSTPKLMNSYNALEKPFNEDRSKYGLSILHAQIKFFECLIHIAYRIPLKTWRVQDKKNNAIYNENKERIQREFRKSLGLIIDRVKTGYGTSNDGNTARKFFRHPEIAADITKIDIALIKNFSTILRVISSFHKVNTIAFKELLKETFDIYLANYSWYYMPQTVHKILVHGCDIIQNTNIPIGFLSEEALEARHKELRGFRLNHSRKTSRTNSNKDVFQRMLLSSEPSITLNRKLTTKKPINNDDINRYLLLEDSAMASEDCDNSDDERD